MELRKTALALMSALTVGALTASAAVVSLGFSGSDGNPGPTESLIEGEMTPNAIASLYARFGPPAGTRGAADGVNDSNDAGGVGSGGGLGAGGGLGSSSGLADFTNGGDRPFSFLQTPDGFASSASNPVLLGPLGVPTSRVFFPGWAPDSAAAISDSIAHELGPVPAITEMPEPASLVLLGSGLLMGRYFRRQKR
jgi:hypothetical protein